MLACTANGRKLHAFNIIKRKTMLKQSFPRDLITRVNEKGQTDEALMREWIRVVRNGRPCVLLWFPSKLVSTPIADT